MASVDADDDELEPSLRNILEQKSLKWIFVGGKGGVGKTTTSCSLAVQLSKARSSVLLVSTDPAHNLSDAFSQKFSKHATPVQGFPNLHAMEIDPTIEVESGDVIDPGSAGVLAELASSIPGIDEAMSFAELMKQVQSMRYDVIVFDTAPTGHTLRLLSFPSVLEKAFEKLAGIKNRFSGILNQVSGMVAPETEQKVMSKLESAKQTIELIHTQFKDPDCTTFVCVCIPEFLSLFETERLVQELARFEIDTHNIVVNQVLFPEDTDAEAAGGGGGCRKCLARRRMQAKYLSQINSLYDDFHVVHMPLLDEEVRGPEAIAAFSAKLVQPAHPPPPPPPPAAQTKPAETASSS